MIQLIVNLVVLAALSLVLLYLNRKMSKRFNDNWDKQEARLTQSVHIMKARHLRAIDGGRPARKAR